MDKRKVSTLLSALAVLMLVVTPLAPASGMMSLSVCGADGVTRTVSVPVERDKEERYDCVKACHGFCSRKHLTDDSNDADD